MLGNDGGGWIRDASRSAIEERNVSSIESDLISLYAGSNNGEIEIGGV